MECLADRIEKQFYERLVPVREELTENAVELAAQYDRGRHISLRGLQSAMLKSAGQTCCGDLESEGFTLLGSSFESVQKCFREFLERVIQAVVDYGDFR